LNSCFFVLSDPLVLSVDIHSSRLSFPKNKIRILLLENIHQNAIDLFQKEGYQIDFHTGTLETEVLKEKIRNVHIVGIRSTTQLTSEIIECTKRLICVGCFCIGTNQVDLEAAEKKRDSSF